MLMPNNEQKTKLFQFANASRFAYNWAIATEEENYRNGGKFISNYDLRKRFTILRHSEGYEWLLHISNNVTKQAIKDACNAYKKFFKGLSGHPKFKSKKDGIYKFYQDTTKIHFTYTHVKLECITLNKKKNRQKLNWIRLAECGRVREGTKYVNARISFDGLNWWISVCEELSNETVNLSDEGIGIDLGLKDLAICSDGNKYKNINKSNSIKKLEKKKRRLQRSISRGYEKNKKEGKYCKTNNIIKKEKQLCKVNHRLNNIRKNHIHQTTTEIVNRKPRFICIEDLNVKGMMKNKHLSKAIRQQCFYEFRRQITYKSKRKNIPVVIADRFFPSSKLCSCCGNIKKDLKLSDRIYRCKCGNLIDRDYQAALNLKRYGEMILDNKSA